MSDDPVFDLASFLPTPSDPRIWVTVPESGRAKLGVLWDLVVRLSKLLEEVREPLIGQIKLAWWRDMMAMVAQDPDALPKGEPLLAELQEYWRGQEGLDILVDAAEALLLAEDDSAREAAAVDFGGQLFRLSSICLRGGGAMAELHAGARWGLLWAAIVLRGGEEGLALLGAAETRNGLSPRAFGKRGKPLVMLDRVSGSIAKLNGARNLRSEGLILLRIGLFGR